MKKRGRVSKALLLFKKSKYHSIKLEKYFKVYDYLFSKYINKKIIFVEIGILNGGSLQIWKKFFGNKARIIGIDLNPKCKKFEGKGIEVFIGDQSNPKFWKYFFRKVGKVDIILDDGGHTNSQQIMTTISCVPNINNNGMLIIEDTHTSYMKEFNNPNRYSFINFVKKCIDDINFTFQNLNSFNYSLNKYIFSIQTFESIVCFYISRERCYVNKSINNKKFSYKNKDFRYHGRTILESPKKFGFLKKIFLIRKMIIFARSIIYKIINKKLDKITSVYFK
jgi:23S rRNA U2552 (ribose-2'-O)-methylase RlmE/FtsJ